MFYIHWLQSVEYVDVEKNDFEMTLIFYFLIKYVLSFAHVYTACAAIW